MAILLLRPDKAGDALKTLPVLRSLVSHKNIKEEIHILLSSHNYSLFELEPHLKLHLLPSEWESMSANKWVDFLKFTPEKIINLPADPSETSQILLENIPSKNKYSVFQKNMTTPITSIHFHNSTPAQKNESQNIADIIAQSLGEPFNAKSWMSFPKAPIFSNEDYQEANLALSSKKNGIWLGLSPMAGLKRRTLPLSRWEYLLKKVIKNKNIERCFIFGSVADKNSLEKIRNRVDSSKVTIIFPSNFRALGAYLLKMDGVISVDSGPLHLSLSLKIPSLGFLSGGDMERWYSEIPANTYLLRRGIFQPYPSSWEMNWAFKKWVKLKLSPRNP